MAKQARSIQGRVVAITGGARGIGRSTAQALVARGAKVAIGDVDRELAERTAAELGGETLALELDVTRRDSFEGFLDQVEERLGSLDVLINNAGIMPLRRFVDEDDETTRRLVEINVHGVMLGMKLALPRMERRGHGHLVNIASQAGKTGFPGGATYCGTKFFVVGLSEAVRAELQGTGVEISCVMPAVVNTELGSGLVETRGIKKLEPEDVAAAIVAALEHPKFDVWVPREAVVVHRLAQLLPRRASDAVAKLFRADKVLAEPDRNVRAGYEQRAAGDREAADATEDAEAPISN